MTRDWTGPEVAYLRSHAHDGAEAIASHLGRTVEAVRFQAKKRGISLRKRGERRGRVLGQPNGGGPEWEWVRRMAVDGMVDIATVEQRIRADAGGVVDICPRCGKRPQRIRRTGLCGVCHLDLLREQTEEALSEIEARREYNAAKKRLQRAREGES